MADAERLRRWHARTTPHRMLREFAGLVEVLSIDHPPVLVLEDLHWSEPALPYAKAFVVQFTAETGARLERAGGRVEHLQMGRRARFASTDDLLACIVALLADNSNASARPRGRTARRGRGSRIEPDIEQPSP